MSDRIRALLNSLGTTATETQQRADFYKQLKKLSQEGHPSGLFVELSNLGPTTIFSAPSHEKPILEPSNREPQTPTASTDNRNDESKPAPFAKEQLGNL